MLRRTSAGAGAKNPAIPTRIMPNPRTTATTLAIIFPLHPCCSRSAVLHPVSGGGHYGSGPRPPFAGAMALLSSRRSASHHAEARGAEEAVEDADALHRLLLIGDS